MIIFFYSGFQRTLATPVAKFVGISEVRCVLANQIANFETKLATYVPTKLINSKVDLFSFFLRRQNHFKL